jgi:hypothetical protein
MSTILSLSSVKCYFQLTELTLYEMTLRQGYLRSLFLNNYTQLMQSVQKRAEVCAILA